MEEPKPDEPAGEFVIDTAERRDREHRELDRDGWEDVVFLLEEILADG